jgi:hypothetical protein
MKKIILILVLFLSFFLFSCNNENKTNIIDINSGEKEYIYTPDISINENQLVIVSISSGKKFGKWPNQRCTGNQKKTCWLWFPKDQGTINPYELYENYAFVSYNGEHLLYYQPRYNFFTGDEMYEYTQISSNGTLNISEDILVSDSFILDELELSSPFIIKSGVYSYEYNDSDHIMLLLDIEPATTIERAYCLIEINPFIDDIHNYHSSPWFSFVDDEGYIEPTDFPLGVFDFDENGCFVMDFYYNLQGDIGLAMLDILRQEGEFYLNQARILNDEHVLNILGSNTIEISQGDYDIEEDDEKIRVNFGYINL